MVRSSLFPSAGEESRSVSNDQLHVAWRSSHQCGATLHQRCRGRRLSSSNIDEGIELRRRYSSSCNCLSRTCSRAIITGSSSCSSVICSSTANSSTIPMWSSNNRVNAYQRREGRGASSSHSRSPLSPQRQCTGSNNSEPALHCEYTSSNSSNVTPAHHGEFGNITEHDRTPDTIVRIKSSGDSPLNCRFDTGAGSKSSGVHSWNLSCPQSTRTVTRGCYLWNYHRRSNSSVERDLTGERRNNTGSSTCCCITQRSPSSLKSGVLLHPLRFPVPDDSAGEYSSRQDDCCCSSSSVGKQRSCGTTKSNDFVDNYIAYAETGDSSSTEQRNGSNTSSNSSCEKEGVLHENSSPFTITNQIPEIRPKTNESPAALISDSYIGSPRASTSSADASIAVAAAHAGASLARTALLPCKVSEENAPISDTGATPELSRACSATTGAEDIPVNQESNSHGAREHKDHTAAAAAEAEAAGHVSIHQGEKRRETRKDNDFTTTAATAAQGENAEDISVNEEKRNDGPREDADSTTSTTTTSSSSYIIYLEPSPTCMLSNWLDCHSQQVAALWGPDPALYYPPHCSLSGFFECRDVGTLKTYLQSVFGAVGVADRKQQKAQSDQHRKTEQLGENRAEASTAMRLDTQSRHMGMAPYTSYGYTAAAGGCSGETRKDEAAAPAQVFRAYKYDNEAVHACKGAVTAVTTAAATTELASNAPTAVAMWRDAGATVTERSASDTCTVVVASAAGATANTGLALNAAAAVTTSAAHAVAVTATELAATSASAAVPPCAPACTRMPRSSQLVGAAVKERDPYHVKNAVDAGGCATAVEVAAPMYLSKYPTKGKNRQTAIDAHKIGAATAAHTSLKAVEAAPLPVERGDVVVSHAGQVFTRVPGGEIRGARKIPVGTATAAHTRPVHEDTPEAGIEQAVRVESTAVGGLSDLSSSTSRYVSEYHCNTSTEGWGCFLEQQQQQQHWDRLERQRHQQQVHSHSKPEKEDIFPEAKESIQQRENFESPLEQRHAYTEQMQQSVLQKEEGLQAYEQCLMQQLAQRTTRSYAKQRLTEREDTSWKNVSEREEQCVQQHQCAQEDQLCGRPQHCGQQQQKCGLLEQCGKQHLYSNNSRGSPMECARLQRTFCERELCIKEQGSFLKMQTQSSAACGARFKTSVDASTTVTYSGSRATESSKGGQGPRRAATFSRQLGLQLAGECCCCARAGDLPVDVASVSPTGPRRRRESAAISNRPRPGDAGVSSGEAIGDSAHDAHLKHTSTRGATSDGCYNASFVCKESSMTFEYALPLSDSSIRTSAKNVCCYERSVNPPAADANNCGSTFSSCVPNHTRSTEKRSCQFTPRKGAKGVKCNGRIVSSDRSSSTSRNRAGAPRCSCSLSSTRDSGNTVLNSAGVHTRSGDGNSSSEATKKSSFVDGVPGNLQRQSVTGFSYCSRKRGPQHLCNSSGVSVERGGHESISARGCRRRWSSHHSRIKENILSSSQVLADVSVSRKENDSGRSRRWSTACRHISCFGAVLKRTDGVSPFADSNEKAATIFLTPIRSDAATALSGPHDEGGSVRYRNTHASTSGPRCMEGGSSSGYCSNLYAGHSGRYERDKMNDSIRSGSGSSCSNNSDRSSSTSELNGEELFWCCSTYSSKRDWAFLPPLGTCNGGSSDTRSTCSSVVSAASHNDASEGIARSCRNVISRGHSCEYSGSSRNSWPCRESCGSTKEFSREDDRAADKSDGGVARSARICTSSNSEEDSRKGNSNSKESNTSSRSSSKESRREEDCSKTEASIDRQGVIISTEDGYVVLCLSCCCLEDVMGQLQEEMEKYGEVHIRKKRGDHVTLASHRLEPRTREAIKQFYEAKLLSGDEQLLMRSTWDVVLYRLEKKTANLFVEGRHQLEEVLRFPSLLHPCSSVRCNKRSAQAAADAADSQTCITPH